MYIPRHFHLVMPIFYIWQILSVSPNSQLFTSNPYFTLSVEEPWLFAL